MQFTAEFAGLTMPVFTAFGWTGEDTAISFALSQLESFVNTLHGRLPREAQERLPSFGLSVPNRNVYLSAASDVESDVHIVFNARPVSLEIQFAMTGRDVIRKGLSHAQNDMARCHRLITELGPDWTLRIQQMQVDDESGETSHYQDIFKDTVLQFDEETAAEVISKAAYLNGESQWVTPLYLSRRYASEQAATMGRQIIEVMNEQV
jgi:hypothetical protein